MKAVLALGLGLVLVGRVGADKVADAEKVVDDMLKTMGEISTLLEGIKDEKTADANIPKLEKAAEQVKDLGKKMKGFKLSKEEDKQLQGKYQKDMQAAFKRLITASATAAKNAPTRAKQISAALSRAKPD